MKTKIGVFCSIGLSIAFWSGYAFSEDLSLSLAKTIEKGCIDYALKNDLKLAIAIFDVHGNMKTYSRMDGTSVATGEMALWKGKSAAIYQYSTEETKKWNVPSAPNLSVTPGGIPLRSKSNKVIGAIGVSGAQSSIDVQCAEAGIKNGGKF